MRNRSLRKNATAKISIIERSIFSENNENFYSVGRRPEDKDFIHEKKTLIRRDTNLRPHPRPELRTGSRLPGQSGDSQPSVQQSS